MVQLVARLTLDQKVPGSIPGPPAKIQRLSGSIEGNAGPEGNPGVARDALPQSRLTCLFVLGPSRHARPIGLLAAARYFSVMCNAYNFRHRNEAILDIARAMQLALADLPEFPPRHRIGITDRGLILRPRKDGPLAWSWARWGLIPSAATRSRSRSTMPAPTSSAAGRGRASSASAAWCRRAASGSRRSPDGRPARRHGPTTA